MHSRYERWLLDGAVAGRQTVLHLRVRRFFCTLSSRHGQRTQLYTSSGTGFWGPAAAGLRRSEMTLLTLRAG